MTILVVAVLVRADIPIESGKFVMAPALLVIAFAARYQSFMFPIWAGVHEATALGTVVTASVIHTG
jgi:hypothetical protein